MQRFPAFLSELQIDSNFQRWSAKHPSALLMVKPLKRQPQNLKGWHRTLEPREEKLSLYLLMKQGLRWTQDLCKGGQPSTTFWLCCQLPLLLEKAMASHSSTLAWKIPWMEEPGRLQSMGSLRVGHDWVTSLSLFTFMHWRRKWQPTPVFLPGESQGRVAWWAAVYGVAQSQTWLKQRSSSSPSYRMIHLKP